MRQLLLAGLLLALLLSAGCSNDPADASATGDSIVLLTRSTVATNADTHRLLVFADADNNDCLLNHSFASGDALKLSDGTYRFVTLTHPECFDIPATGTTTGIGFNEAPTLKADVPLKAVLVSSATSVTLPTSAAYTANLKPATCVLKLQLVNVPEGLTLTLKNMPAGLSLSGNYTGVSTIAHTLDKNAGTYCLPTAGNAVIAFSVPAGSSGDLDLGMPIEAGHTYSVPLQWNEGKIQLASTIKQWESSSENGDAEME